MADNNTSAFTVGAKHGKMYQLNIETCKKKAGMRIFLFLGVTMLAVGCASSPPPLGTCTGANKRPINAAVSEQAAIQSSACAAA